MHNNSEKSCPCNKSDQLLIERKTVSRLVALLLLLFFFSFVIGYFWGKRHAVSTFAHKIEQESFADKIYYNTSLLYDHKGPASVEPKPELAEGSKDADELKQSGKNIEIIKPQIVEKISTKRYQGQVFGGTQKAAQQCCDRLQKNGVPVLMVKRSSKTPKGKTITWYQVVTEPFSDHQELAIVLDAIKLQEKIRDIHIVELTDNANDHQKKG